MDGMGRNVEHWIGITDAELNEWRSTGELPKCLRLNGRRRALNRQQATIEEEDTCKA
jgi:hypothetical protein